MSSVDLCIFTVGHQEYAVDIRRVEIVLPSQKVTPAPQEIDLFEGFISVRGSNVPVVDLRRRFIGVAASQASRSSSRPKFLLCRIGIFRVALIVDSVPGPFSVLRNSIQQVPAWVSPQVLPCVVGVCGPSERAKLLLNVKALFKRS